MAIWSAPVSYYQIPHGWAMEDIIVRNGSLYYKNMKKSVPVIICDDERNVPIFVEEQNDGDCGPESDETDTLLTNN